MRRLAITHHLPCEIERVDVVRSTAMTNESMELAARNARRDFFGRCAKKHRCRRVLLAHHADDQAETILFNLIRGGGGLRGMRFSAEHKIGEKQLTFIRPFLEISRTQIDDYVIARKIRYREDTSNAEPIATRNRIRNEVMPLLSEIMGRDIHPSILRAAEISASKEQVLVETLDTLCLKDPQGRLFLPKLTTLPPALQLMALHDYLKNEEVSDISHDLLVSCQGLLHSTHPSKINLPGGKFFRRKEKRLFIST